MRANGSRHTSEWLSKPWAMRYIFVPASQQTAKSIETTFQSVVNWWYTITSHFTQPSSMMQHHSDYLNISVEERERERARAHQHSHKRRERWWKERAQNENAIIKSRNKIQSHEFIYTYIPPTRAPCSHAFYQHILAHFESHVWKFLWNFQVIVRRQRQSY